MDRDRMKQWQANALPVPSAERLKGRHRQVMKDKIKIDMLFFSNEKHKPICSKRTGMSVDVHVAVTCDNGVEFMGVDRYDSISKSWLNNYEKEGKHVVAWAYPPCVSQFNMFSTPPTYESEDNQIHTRT